MTITVGRLRELVSFGAGFDPHPGACISGAALSKK
jgi:hypothetical protein